MQESSYTTRRVNFQNIIEIKMSKIHFFLVLRNANELPNIKNLKKSSVLCYKLKNRTIEKKQKFRQMNIHKHCHSKNN